MRFLLAAVLLGLSVPAGARGENDEDTATPGLIPSGGLMLYYDSKGPLSFVTMTPRDVPKGARQLGTVSGSSCQHGLSVPVTGNVRGTSVSGAYGDGSFLQAVAHIKKQVPETTGIYDVRVDQRVFSILGIYRKQCTLVTARAFAAAN
ncbi:MAG: TRL-like family protein [Elusimicrobiota bacterium]|nr:MAG: TRL-like family protein [Elusimicrobiota bacterium]